MEFLTYYFVRYIKTDKSGSIEEFVQHQRHLQKIDNEGKLMFVSPLGDGTGGILFVKAKDAEEATEIVSGDPYVQLGVMDISVHPIYIPKPRDIAILHERKIDYDFIINNAISNSKK